jgi:hypothetical protein
VQLPNILIQEYPTLKIRLDAIDAVWNVYKIVLKTYPAQKDKKAKSSNS